MRYLAGTKTQIVENGFYRLLAYECLLKDRQPLKTSRDSAICRTVLAKYRMFGAAQKFLNIRKV